MKKLQKQIKELQNQLRDLEAFAGVLLPVFEKEYRKGGWDFAKK